MPEDIRIAPQEDEEDDDLGKLPERDEELGKKKSVVRDEELGKKKSVVKALLDIFTDVEKGFKDQAPRSDDLMDFWDIYNCKLNEKQFYSGNSEIYMPITHDAIEARKTRFVNQMFPISGRNVDCVSEDGTVPQAIIALAEHHVEKAKLRTHVMPALMKNGDVEGQYTVYVSWLTRKRFVVQKTQTPVIAEDIPTGETAEDIEEVEIEDGHPYVEVIADSDLLVLPQTSSSIADALSNGGSATVLRRWGKAKIQQMAADGDIMQEAADDLCEEMTKDEEHNRNNKEKKMVEAAGVHVSDGNKFALVYETWTMIKVAGDRRVVRAYYAGNKKILSCKRNPYWNDRVPIISEPVEKVQGSFKGISQIAPIATIQYQANDACNEGMDSAAYALLPIVMTDPLKNPKVGSMILSLAAVWETSPNDTKFVQLPQLWKEALEIVATARSQIFQTLSVNPSAITQQGSSKTKRNQAEIAQEQQVDILTTADAVIVVEQGILTPLINFFIELDHQFRDKDIAVKQYGDLGERASIQDIPPMQFDKRYHFRWFGVESARAMQQVQQQIASLNVLRGIPPDQLGGHKVNLVPTISQMVENIFGPRLAPLTFISPEQQMPVPIQEENAMLMNGFEVPVHELDDDDMHIQAHMPLLQIQGGGGSKKKVQVHIFAHIQQKQKKQQAQMQAQSGQGAQQGPPGGQAGMPRPGAQPRNPRPQGPPGMIHKDQMQDPNLMPRKM